MLLTCPTCLSGLQVPDGTTASVRCPTCRTVFSAAQGTAPPPEPPPTPPPRPVARPRVEDDEDRPRRRIKAERDDEDDDDDRPRRKTRPTADEIEDAEDEKENERQRRRERRDIETGLTAEERAEQRTQYRRSMWGCRLLATAFGLYAGSLMVVLIFQVVAVVADPMPELILIAGVLGGLNWVLAAVGVGLCISGRPGPGHYGFGIGAATAMLVHAVLLCAVLARNADKAALLGADVGGNVGAAAQLPTKLDSLAFYLACAVYPDEKLIPRDALALSLVTGVAELVRLLLIMMLLACVARAAGDTELSDRCTRAAGVGTFGPGALAVGMLLLSVSLVETGGMDKSIGKILMSVFEMGIYAILAGMLMPAFVAMRDAADASEYPFQAKSVSLAP